MKHEPARCICSFATPAPAAKPMGVAAARRLATEKLVAEQQTLRVGGYMVTRLGDVVWITNPEGEGMATTEAKLAKELGKFWRREF